MSEKLTERKVAALKPPAKGYALVFDSELTGFGVRINAGGTKSFIAQYRVNGAAMQRLKIGQFPAWSVQRARDEAKEVIIRANRGEHPSEERATMRAAPTVRELFERYEAEHLPRLAVRSQADQLSMIRSYVLPALGSRRVHEVTAAEVDALHRRISAEGKLTRANRVFEVVRKAFNLAIRWNMRTDNPALGVGKNAEHPKERFLTDEELQRVHVALDACANQDSADAIRLLILTGARCGEVLGASWAEFDLHAGIWTKLPARTKQRRVHRVIVSQAVLTVLKRRAEQAAGPLVFPGRGTTGSLANIKRTWVHARHAAGLDDVRLHDLRHTFASMAIRGGTALPVLSKLLGHSQPQVTNRYVGIYDEVMREAVEGVSKAMHPNRPNKE